MRHEKELHAKINELKQAWKESQDIEGQARLNLREYITGQLISLYWVLGHSRKNAIDMASVDLGGDPIDWSP